MSRRDGVGARGGSVEKVVCVAVASQRWSASPDPMSSCEAGPVERIPWAIPPGALTGWLRLAAVLESRLGALPDGHRGMVAGREGNGLALDPCRRPRLLAVPGPGGAPAASAVPG